MSSSESLWSRRQAVRALPAGLLSLGWASGLKAQVPRVLVWTGESFPAQQEVIEAMQRSFAGRVQAEFKRLDARAMGPVAPGLSVQVVLGTRPLREWVALASSMPEWLRQTPVLAALMPFATYAPLASQLPPGSSAVWLDQPVERFCALIARAVPRWRRVGVLVGPQAPAEDAELERAARAHRLQLVWARLTEETHSLFGVLSQMLSDVDVLLALPDPAIYNNDTLQNILIAAYRQRVPMVSYAESHVRAGATLGLYTTPREVALQVDTALQVWLNTRRLPVPAFAARGNVAVNVQVARSLGLELPTPAELEAVLAGERR